MGTDLQKPTQILLEEDIQTIGLEWSQGYEILFVSKEVFISTPEYGSRIMKIPSLENVQAPGGWSAEGKHPTLQHQCLVFDTSALIRSNVSQCTYDTP